MALSSPTSQPQAFAPEGYGYAAYANPPPPPPPPGGAKQAVKNLVHTGAHAAASSAGQAVGHALGGAAIAALLARGAVAGGEIGAVGGGPIGMAGGALIGAVGAGVGDLAVQGLMRRGGTGGSNNSAPEVAGTVSGFRPQGRNIDQSNIAAQQRAHVAGGSTAAYT